MSKFICDGCSKILDTEDLGGKIEISRGGGAYGCATITLLYCKDCWTKRHQKEDDNERQHH